MATLVSLFPSQGSMTSQDGTHRCYVAVNSLSLTPDAEPRLLVIMITFDGSVSCTRSRPVDGESHPRTLADPGVSLATHPHIIRLWRFWVPFAVPMARPPRWVHR